MDFLLPILTNDFDIEKVESFNVDIRIKLKSQDNEKWLQVKCVEAFPGNNENHSVVFNEPFLSIATPIIEKPLMESSNFHLILPVTDTSKQIDNLSNTSPSNVLFPHGETVLNETLQSDQLIPQSPQLIKNDDELSIHLSNIISKDSLLNHHITLNSALDSQSLYIEIKKNYDNVVLFCHDVSNTYFYIFDDVYRGDMQVLTCLKKMTGEEIIAKLKSKYNCSSSTIQHHC